MAFPNCQVQRGPVVDALYVNLGTASKQDFGDCGMPLLSCLVQGSPTIGVRCVNVSTCGE